MCTRKRQIDIAVLHGNAPNATSKVDRNSRRLAAATGILVPIDSLRMPHLLRVLLKK
jgi:hypothetical protein